MRDVARHIEHRRRMNILGVQTEFRRRGRQPGFQLIHRAAPVLRGLVVRARFAIVLTTRLAVAATYGCGGLGVVICAVLGWVQVDVRLEFGAWVSLRPYLGRWWLLSSCPFLGRTQVVVGVAVEPWRRSWPPPGHLGHTQVLHEVAPRGAVQAAALSLEPVHRLTQGRGPPYPAQHLSPALGIPIHRTLQRRRFD